jgi:diguanylate cyclase (GGDEF)-like protein
MRDFMRSSMHVGYPRGKPRRLPFRDRGIYHWPVPDLKLPKPAAAALALALCAAAAQGEAGLGSYLFSTLGAKDGLPNASVSGLVQDRTGYIWLGTQGGLARYDGYSFKLFERVPFDESSLPHNQVQSLYLDDGSLWVGTYGGLARLDLATERFVSFVNDPDDGRSLSNDVVTSVVRDRRGSIWVGTLSGLNRLDESTGKFERFLNDPSDPRSLPGNVVRALEVDGKGRLWIGTSGGGLALFEYATRTFRAYRKGGPAGRRIMSDYVMSIDEDRDGRLWLGTWYGGISRLDPETGECLDVPLADDRVYVVMAEEGGVVLAGTWGGGLFEYDSRTGRVERYRSTGASGSLSHDVVYSLLRDRSGDVWIGTNGGGVCRLASSRRSFGAVTASAEGLPPGKVYSVLRDRRGFLWVGVYNAGLARRDPSTGAWKRYRHDPRDGRSLPNDIVNCLFEDSTGALWAGTNDGLARYDRASDSFSVVRPVAGRKDWLSSEIVFSLAEAPGGGLWIGTFRTGLELWNRAAGRFEHYAADSGGEGAISDNLVNALEYDSQGRLWAGTNKGLNALEGDRFRRYLYDPAKTGGVSSDSVKTLFRDSRGTMWIGTTGGGLMRYEAETDSFVSYTKRDGLPSNSVVRILEDGAGDLWIATQAGLVIYDRSAGRFRAMSIYDELGDREFFPGAFKDSDGTLYFGSLDSLFRFDPGSFEFNAHVPSVVLTDISSPGLPTSSAAGVSKTGRLDLAWRDNSVRFRFSALDFRDPERNRYSYRLEGLDALWSEPSDQREAAYVDLPGGRYTFRVRASNNDGLWNEDGLSIDLRVGYAPLKHPISIAAYAVLLAAAGYAFAQWRLGTRLRAAIADRDSLRGRLDETRARLDHASIVDAMTGLPNRRRAEELLEEAFSRSARAKAPLSALMADIDNFKSYNDRYGKAAGDDCLVRVARALSSCLERSTDLVARYGGEEFLVVMQGVDIEGARAAAEKARKAVEDLDIPRGESRPSPVVTVSVGCASVEPESGQVPALLIAAVEKALFAAKQRGRNIASD